MQPRRDIGIFVALVIAYSTVLSIVARNVLSNSLIVIAAASVILSARGVAWKRKLPYASVALGGFIVFDLAFDLFGLTERFSAFGVEPASTALGLVYMVFVLAYPLAVLLMFVGRDPSELWVKTAVGGAKTRKPTRRTR